MRVYLAGPMSGIPAFNIPAFSEATADLRERGYEVVSPAELDDKEFRWWCLSSEDGDISKAPEELRQSWGDLLARDVKLIADGGIEGIVVLEGWRGSRGARLETFVGRLCGLPIYNYLPGEDFLDGVWAEDVLDAHGLQLGEIDDYYADFGDDRIEPKPTLTDAEDMDLMTSLIQRTNLEQFMALPQNGGEVRVTDPETGGQKGQKLAQIGALDPLSILEVGKVAGFGAQKYDRFNFARGYAWSLSYDALQRHLHQWAAGDEVDEESGLSHLGHAAWHCLALLTFVLRERGTDDRLHQTLETS